MDTKSKRASVLLVSASNSMCCAHIPALLARANLNVTVMGPGDSPALASRHVAHRMRADGGVRAVRRHLRALLTSSNADRFSWVILGDEAIVVEVAAFAHERWAASCFPVEASSFAEKMISHKTAFISACQDAGIAVPDSRICTGANDALIAAGEIGYPLLMKADFGASGSTVWRIETASELVDAIPRAAERPFVLQALIQGEAGVTEMICAHGKPLAIVSSLMRGIDPAPFGPASSRLYRKSPQAEAIAFRLASLTGFHGFCGFDWVQRNSAENDVFVIDFHTRPTLGFHMAHHAGVDFAEAAKGLVSGNNVQLVVQPSNREATCLFFPKDFTRALRKRDVLGLLRWLPGTSRNDLPWTDPGLLWTFARRYMRTRIGIRSRPAMDSRLQESTAFQDDL